MKAIVAFSLLLLAVSAKHINKGTWTATTENQFTDMTDEQIKSCWLGTIIEPLTGLELVDSAVEAPTNFDARTQWPNFVHPIRDQGQCGSCWAFGASEAFSDRIAIATNGATNVVLSPEQLVSCDTGNYGCSGGYLNVAWAYIAKNGLVADSCFPYTAGSGTAPACRKTCVDGSTWTAYKSLAAKTFTAAAAKTEISTNGPIETAFSVYRDFMSYSGGIYQYDGKSSYLGGHAIKVVGWGVDAASGLNYWIAANSWGTSWGENGFFRIAAGQCGFDSNFIAGQYAGSAADSFLEEILF
jgi:cathepsin B